MGNMWETPLYELAREYNARSTSNLWSAVERGPAALAKEHGLELPDDFVDECHYCYTVRKALVDRFPHISRPNRCTG